MSSRRPEVVVGGHICLDVIPRFEGGAASLEELLVPGKLINVGPAVVSTGGVVSNTGLALHRLGVRTRLMGKIGNDLFGQAILGVLRSYDPALAEGMLTTTEAPSSYTLVINPPGVDRIFLHCPGANDTFGADDIPYAELSGVRLFHFGYPPLMRRMFIDGGEELASLLSRVKAQGPVTCLDMARPDPASEAGQAPWETILMRALPHVDLFFPSFDEILFMLDRPRFIQLNEVGEVTVQAEPQVVQALAERLLEMGAAVVILKLGSQGIYLRTTAEAARLATLSPLITEVERWRDRECIVPCFQVEVVGTTGSGDCAVAGFLAALLHGLSPERAITSAVAVGACNVEAADATSGIPNWAQVQARLAGTWARRPMTMPLDGWRWDESQAIWRSARDLARIH